MTNWKCIKTATPPNAGEYLITAADLKGMYPPIATTDKYFTDDGKWLEYDPTYTLFHVTHWDYLPEPYRKENK